MQPRYQVIESKAWYKAGNPSVSIYGANPIGEGWTVKARGWTIRDNWTGTVGLGRKPFATREEAQAVAERLNGVRS